MINRIFVIVCLFIMLAIGLYFGIVEPEILKRASAEVMDSIPEPKVLDVLNEENEKVGIIVVKDASPTTLFGNVYVYTPDECPVWLGYEEDKVTVTCLNGPSQNYIVHADLQGKYMYIEIQRIDIMQNAKGG